VADPAEWWFAQEVHIRAPFLFIRAVLPSMIERRLGRIIVVSAIGSYRVDHSMSAYCLGKTAQNRLVAARLAQFGFTSHPHILENPKGYFKVMGSSFTASNPHILENPLWGSQGFGEGRLSTPFRGR
jgi:hypothetical protein